MEKRSIIPRAIFCACHGFVASFFSANHFNANTNLAEPYPTDIASNRLLSSQTIVTIVVQIDPNSKAILFDRPNGSGILSVMRADGHYENITHYLCVLKIEKCLLRSDGFLGKTKHHPPSEI